MLGASVFCLASLCDPGQSWSSLVLIPYLIRDWTWVSGSHPTHPHFNDRARPQLTTHAPRPCFPGCWLIMTSFVGTASEFIFSVFLY